MNNINNIIWRLIGTALTLVLFISGCTYNVDLQNGKESQDKFSDKRILMISSYSPSFHTFYKQIDGVKSIFETYNIQLDNEFMDTKRFYTDENIVLFKEYLTYKLNNLPPYDAIIAADDNAIDFVIENRHELFGDTPIFFTAVNHFENAVSYSKDENITGVFEAPSYHDTIQLAFDLNPNAEKVIGLVDSTTSGQGDLSLFLSEINNFETLDFEVINLSELTFNEFKSQLKALAKEDIVILISVYRDTEGTTCSFEQGLELVLENVNAPIYHTYEHGLGNGILGGNIVSQFSQGKSVANLVLEYFEGTPMRDISLVDESPNHYMIDWQVFSSFNMDKNSLPDNVIFINKTDSFIEKNITIIMISFVIFLLEGFMIALLIYALKNSKESKQKLIITNEQLACSLEAVKKETVKFST